jgi:YebC/PmpR family DNA-binding regulatory protein
MFTRVIRELTIAAKLGGGDPVANPRLRTAIQAAKDVNMPAKNIEHAIKKGTGEMEGVSYEEVTYEGYGPGGVAILVDTSTDNRNRTTSEIRHLFSKYNGSLGAVGSVAYLFTRKGIIVVSREGAEEDKLIEAALDAGAEDVKTDDDSFQVFTPTNSLQEVREKLEAAGFKVQSSEVSNIPSTSKKVEGREAETLLKLLSFLEDHDDVQLVSSNFEMSDELIEQFQS